MATDTALPPPPPGCCWVPAPQYAAAIGKSPTTVRDWCDTGLMTGNGKPLCHRLGGRWFVAAPVVQPEPKRPAPDIDPQALARDLAAALAPYLGGK
jgi:hypothetical protein